MSISKRISAFILTAFLCSGLFAAEKNVRNDQKQFQQGTEKVTIFQLGFLPGLPSAMRNYTVYGLKLGLPIIDGYTKLYGLEASFLYSGTDYITGVQASWFGPSISKSTYGFTGSWFGPAISENVDGMQATMLTSIAQELYGFQASSASVIYKYGLGCQASIASVAANFDGFQTGAANVTYKQFNGFQFGAFNLAKNFDGCQIGAFNFVTGLFDAGVQVGVFNFSRHNGIQLGGINVIADGYLPFTIIFNYSFRNNK